MPNDQAHRPPSPDFWKTQNSKAPVPSANGGSVQRPCSATCSFHSQNLRPTRSGSAVTASLATAQRIKPRMARMGTDKNIHVTRAMILRLPIPQEETEQTEDRVRLRGLRCLLFTPPGVRTPSNEQAHRPPSPDFWKSHTTADPVPSANGGSVPRPSSAPFSIP